VRHRRRMTVGEPVGQRLRSDLRNAAAKQLRVAIEMENVPRLYAGVAPPLRLFAPRCVHEGIEAAHLPPAAASSRQLLPQ